MFVSEVKYEEAHLIFHMGPYDAYSWKENRDISGCNY